MTMPRKTSLAAVLFNPRRDSSAVASFQSGAVRLLCLSRGLC